MFARTALSLVLLASLCFVTDSKLLAETDPPNFVLIFIDDQGYQDIGCFGSPTIKTPNLDKMAREGRRFTDFYSLAPVCSASRAALMTGCYPPRVGITGVLFPRHKIGLNPSETTIAETLKTKGYATAAVGKWHLGHLPKFLPTNHGFDSYFGIPYSNDMDKVKSPGKGVTGLDNAYRADDATFWNVPLMRDTEVIERPAKQVTITKRYTEESIRFIEKNKNGRFFLYLAHTMPHIPVFTTEKFKGKSKGGPYGDSIEEIDWSVGQVLDALERNGVADNTLVVYTSDNGPWLSMKHHGGSALPLRGGKFSTHEGGMRVPTIMRWPKRIKAGTVCSQVGASFDLLPTFAALAGAQLSSESVIDGLDISSIIVGGDDAKTPRDLFCYYKGGRLEAVRSGDWKLRLPKGKKKDLAKAPNWELYNLAEDMSETTNVAKANLAKAGELLKRAQAYDAKLQAAKRPAGSLEPQKSKSNK